MFVQVKLDHMDSNLGKSAMDQPKNHEEVQYSTVDTRNEGLGFGNQRFFLDPSSNINTNMRPPDYNVSFGTKPVLNYSIQTGEEFSLEFMRERVIPRQHLVPHASGDPNSAPSYMGLKGILGISHTGSENGSDVSMLNSVEKGRVQEFERKGSSAHEGKSYHDSVRLPQASSRNDINRGLSGYASSPVSDSSPSKVKFLCSFGGKILPRPSDGKLRYVGGETRIIRINKDIFWQDLMQKLLTIYDQTHTIKYQLPGEDLDALVSVSCDEDLQNMMEECSVVQDGRSQRPRMFLFSILDLEESHFGMESVDGDSEIQFVVAVNGMDLGSRKNSVALASSSGNNLEELLSLDVAKESTHGVPDTTRASTVPSAADVPSSANQYSQSVVPGSSSAYESNSQPYQGQKMHSGEARQHPLSTFHPVESSPERDEQTTVLSSVPLQYDLGEMKLKRDSSAQKINEPEKIQSLEKEAPLKEARMKRDSSLQKISETDEIRNLGNENTVSARPYEGLVPNYITKGDVSSANSIAEAGSPFLATKSSKKLQVPRQNSGSSEDVHEGKRNNEDDDFHTSSGLSIPGYGGSEVDSMDFSSLEQPVVPPRVYHSERIPREQPESNRLSKSGDSFGSQFMVAQARPDHSRPIMDSVDKLHDENVTLQSEQSVSPSKLLHKNPQAVEDGLAQLEKHKDFAENTNKMNSDAYDEGLERKVQKPDLSETGRLKDNYRDPNTNDKQAAGMTQLIAGQETSLKPTDETASGPPEFEWNGIAANTDYGNNAEGHGNPLAWKENPVKGGAHDEPAVAVGTPEQGDILIDINDRFPRDFLSDVFSKARIDLSGVSPLPGDGTGLSMNLENRDPKRWSYFRNLAQNEFVRKDVSLMDQDHLGFSSLLTVIGEGAPVDYSYPPLNPPLNPPLKSDGVAFGQADSHISFDEDIRQNLTGPPNAMNLDSDYNHSPLEGIESEQVDGVNHRVRESEYEVSLFVALFTSNSQFYNIDCL